MSKEARKHYKGDLQCGQCPLCGNDGIPVEIVKELETTYAADLQPAPRAEGERDFEYAYRKLLWLTHGHTQWLYGDDGEMQCNGQYLADFKRDPINRLEGHAMLAKVEAINRASAPKEAPEQGWIKWLRLYALLREQECSCNIAADQGFNDVCEWCAEHPEGNWDETEKALKDNGLSTDDPFLPAPPSQKEREQEKK